MPNIQKLKMDLKGSFDIEEFLFFYENSYHYILVPVDELLAVCTYFFESNSFDYLVDLFAIEKQIGKFQIVYQFLNSKSQFRIFLKVNVDEKIRVSSIQSVWKSANWLEREVFDMFGIEFLGHSNLRRILNPQSFNGFPLRKNFQIQEYQIKEEDFYFDDGSCFKELSDDVFPMQIDPSYPATQGNLSLFLAIQDEVIVKAGVEIGFLHRGLEKTAEQVDYQRFIPFVERLNYNSSPINNIGFCKLVEKFSRIEIPAKAQAIRILMCELARIYDHFQCFIAHIEIFEMHNLIMRIKAVQESIASVFENYTGSRLGLSASRIGGMISDTPEGWYEDVIHLSPQITRLLSYLELNLFCNKIWQQRVQGIAETTAEQALSWGLSGPNLRAAGVGLDLRKVQPYYGYETLDFDIPTGTKGDVYDRFMVRFCEIQESNKIILQIAKNVPGGDYVSRELNSVLPEKKEVYGNIEGMIHHFHLVVNGFSIPKGEIYDSIEASNGELGFYLCSSGQTKPQRLRFRAPSFLSLQSLKDQLHNIDVEDVFPVLGSLNPIAGEFDR